MQQTVTVLMQNFVNFRYRVSQYQHSCEVKKREIADLTAFQGFSPRVGRAADPQNGKLHTLRWEDSPIEPLFFQRMTEGTTSSLP